MKHIIFAITVLSTALFAASLTQANSQSNKELVVSFYQEALIDQQVEAAAMKYLTEDYIQHNPYVATGRQGFITGLTGWFSAVDVKFEIIRAIAEDDHVVLHIKQTSDGKTKSLVDIFRVENGKIAEHWDVVQDVPEKMAHENGMF
ncbi:MAG: nuclear transport factor 2 family protein [Arenicella sp.]